VRASKTCRIVLIGQAPGARVHNTGIPWNDPSGDLLRVWMGLGRETFYDESRIALMPMGFCYPGKGRSGDLPPRPECAPLWHERIFQQMPAVRLTVLIGQYAQSHYLGGRSGKTLADTVKDFATHLPRFLPLPHPSPRNRLWLRRNAWFDQTVVPRFRQLVDQILNRPN
jgi:uracil-DNA glycosylase